MKILMTGATGLVGQALGAELFRRGHELVVVSRSASAARMQLPFPCQIWEGDLSRGSLPETRKTESEKTEVVEQLNSIDGVINLMGESIAKGFWTAGKKIELERSRVTSTENLVRSFLGNKPSVFISTSAIGYYGNRGDEVLKESSSPGGDFLAKLCQKWELVAQGFGGQLEGTFDGEHSGYREGHPELQHHGSVESGALRSSKTRVVIPRIGVVLAKSGGMLPEILPLFQAGLGGALGNGQQWMSWIHLDDLVKVLIFALENPKLHGVINVTSPAPIRNIEFTQLLAAKLSRPAILTAPQIVLKTVLGEKASLLLNSQRVLPDVLQNLEFEFQFSELAPALSSLLKEESEGETVFEKIFDFRK